MFQYRITKYNPENRTADGKYTADEWTSISDIGKRFCGEILTYQSYLDVENSYLETIEMIMNLNKTEIMEVKKPETNRIVKVDNLRKKDVKNFIKKFEQDNKVNVQDVLAVSKLCLREIFWCELVADDMYIHFGYDYYMYIGSRADVKDLVKSIEDKGLFIEPFISPYNTDYEMMYDFLGDVVRRKKDIVKRLKEFSQGIGCGYDGVSCIFADDPDENDPRYMTECPELIGLDAVMFTSYYYPDDLIVSYQVFYDALKKKIFDNFFDSPNYKEILKYLELIRQRYNLR